MLAKNTNLAKTFKKVALLMFYSYSSAVVVDSLLYFIELEKLIYCIIFFVVLHTFVNKGIST